MSKELEAFKKIVQEANKCGMWHCAIEINIVEEALTPPTAEEVCVELDKWYIEATGDLLIANINDFIYDENEKRFYKRMLNKPHQMTICRLDTNDCVQLRESLPPHLITLIGRFYEGLK